MNIWVWCKVWNHNYYSLLRNTIISEYRNRPGLLVCMSWSRTDVHVTEFDAVWNFNNYGNFFIKFNVECLLWKKNYEIQVGGKEKWCTALLHCSNKLTLLVIYWHFYCKTNIYIYVLTNIFKSTCNILTFWHFDCKTNIFRC